MSPFYDRHVAQRHQVTNLWQCRVVSWLSAVFQLSHASPLSRKWAAYGLFDSISLSCHVFFSSLSINAWSKSVSKENLPFHISDL
jgi:hypothetical protein